MTDDILRLIIRLTYAYGERNAIRSRNADFDSEKQKEEDLKDIFFFFLKARNI